MAELHLIGADELARRGELDAGLDRDGVPRRPVVLVAPTAGEFTPPWTSQAAGPIVVLVREGAGAIPASLARFADVTLAPPGIDRGAVELMDPVGGAHDLADAVAASPRAALALAGLLRLRVYETVGVSLLAESAVYSMLQGGAEYAHWLSTHRRRASPAVDAGPRVRVVRRDATLHVALTRAPRHNALDVRMRDELLSALALARWDPTLQVLITGEGSTFCSGGDLDEFGTAEDPPAAHLVRLDQSLGGVLHELADRTEVRVHGDCHGAGVELPAFASRVVAAPGTTFRLPEIAMGLIPGAGGTTSLPRRIGPARALWLAITGQRLNALTALAWGLVDDVQ